MKMLKIQTLLVAVILLATPLFNLQKVHAFTSVVQVNGSNMYLERNQVIAKGDKVAITAKFKDTKADSYQWEWNICGNKSKKTTKQWYVDISNTFNKVGNCAVIIEGQAIYDAKKVNGQPTGGVIVPGYVKDTIKVLPVEKVAFNVTSPTVAKVGERFNVEANYSPKRGYSYLKWTQSSTGVCKGSSEQWTRTYQSSAKMSVLVKGKKEGFCTNTFALRVEYPDKVLKGSTSRVTKVQNSSRVAVPF